jgi:hypothetical protein
MRRARRAIRGLQQGGLLAVDLMGGASAECAARVRRRNDLTGASFLWEQGPFDPASRRIVAHLSLYDPATKQATNSGPTGNLAARSSCGSPCDCVCAVLDPGDRQRWNSRQGCFVRSCLSIDRFFCVQLSRRRVRLTAADERDVLAVRAGGNLCCDGKDRDGCGREW